MKKLSEKKRFSIISRKKSFVNAIRGLGILMKTQENAWLHLFFAIIAVTLGVLLSISPLEWVAIMFAIGFVLVCEALNTALEIDIDLTSPDYHPYARDTKDVAAGAVLISAITALSIGMFVFLPKIIEFLN